MVNKYKIASNLFFTLSVLLIVIMLLKSYIEYQNFVKHPEWSAPFSTHLLVLVVTYLFPIIIALILAYIFKYKVNKK
ncbi:hypothetical protein AN964_13670 [Heyndrickxia shackletonii]|uniref:NADH dehydrogenase subunit 6 n=1 Tax=Heyndrickxia shackletonii TaxID=157838 RepID=A0A0Q3WWN3_9BACI|nr:hypothetical protein [Heyndrickxia shackletonii]KQL54439.1 hypothetical protein AN964_13670 [Heyndrickxia shackletonii]MBB2479666.1 hypothetical protein [Bacillus sp. APMAM]NEY99162.1 hypothetical protein [Heyndrickxia shackletonii]RTZ56886.1 hypothetical protein EKO25_05365 [Bacillus sp. SAJ1]